MDKILDMIELGREKVWTDLNEIESVIKKKNLPTNKSSGWDGLIGEFYQMVKELTPILLNLFQKISEEGIFLNSFYEASIILNQNQMKIPQKSKL